MKTFLVVILVLLAWSANTQATCKNILVLGDSLSAAYGMRTEQSWVSLLQKHLKKTNPDYCLINVSVSGDTTQEGLAKIPRLLKEHNPNTVIIELGGNDALRGTPIPTIKKNLKEIIQTLKENKVKILVLGVRIPPNYGPEYTTQFQNIFQELADTEKVPFIPKFLQGIAENPDLMQADGIHPKPEAQPKLRDKVLKALKL